jgi:hypothetical protein
MALHHDTANDLFYRHWSGSSWSALGPALETTLTSGSQREPFMFAWTKVVEYDVHFEIWNMTSNTVRETIGSCLDRSTYGDDVQCLIPGVMAKTIAADEVVRIRMAHSSPGGTFLIQFDDLVPAPNSRATLPIPEFPIVLAPILALFIPLVIRRMHRRKRGKATRETNPPKPAWGACF